MVPVLSSTMAVSLWAVSSASPPLMRMPFSAPRPVPTMIAVGVASPRAHGHAMMSTETAVTSAMLRRDSAGEANHQTTNVTRAMAITMGTNTPLILSARRAIGALLPWASCTSRTICWSAESAPTLVATSRSAPVVFIVAPKTLSPAAFSTGTLSPVSIDSSTADWPLSTFPSTGIFSPGRTSTRSPTTTDSIGTSCSVPSRMTRAVLACIPMSRLMAALVRPVARASKYLPSRIRTMMTAAAS
jgi:hypothetical protein